MEEYDDGGEPRALAGDGQPTGDRAVDAAVASLERLDRLPVAEHVAVYESAHSALREALDRAGDA